MRKKLKQSFSLFFALVLTFTVILTGCSKEGVKTEEVKQVDSLGTEKSDTKELYTIQVLTRSQVANVVQNSSETPIFKIIKEKFNIEFELIPTSENIKEQLNMMLAGGNYPEIIRLEDQDTVDKYITAGALLPLDPYLDNSPNFKEFYKDSIDLWRLSGGDGKLYNWNIYMPQDLANFPENNDILVRRDVLEEAGWPNILSADDYVKLLGDFIKKHPETDGQKNVGMTAPFGESWGMAGIAPIMYEKGGYLQLANGAVIWNDPDKKFEDMIKNDYTKESFQFFNKLYRAGALDLESFTDKLDQVGEKINSGRALASWYCRWLASGANQGFEKSGKTDLQYILLPIKSPKQIANNEKRTVRLATNRPFDTVAITKNAKYPERIMELVDWIASDEGQILVQSGIEGIHYTRVNGKRVPTEEFKNSVASDPDYWYKQGFSIVDMLGYAAASSKVDGQPYDLLKDVNTTDELLPQGVTDAYKAMGWENSMQWWTDNAEGVTVGVAASVSVNPSTELGALEARITDLRIKYSSQLMMAKSDEEFETIYNTLLEEHGKLQPEKVVDEYNRLYAEGMEELAKMTK